MRNNVLPNLESFARNLAFIMCRDDTFANVTYNKRETQLRMFDIVLDGIHETNYSEEEICIMSEALMMTIEQLNIIFEEERESRKNHKLLKII